MNKLKIFSTETQYDLAKDDFEWATVSLLKDVDEIRYMTKPEDYSQTYLTFEALESGTFKLTVPANVDSTYMTSVSYSTNNGETWVDTTIDNTEQTITTLMVNARGKVLWKGVGKQMALRTGGYSSFSATGNYIVSGNIMSLLYGDEFADQVTFPSGSMYNFWYLFTNSDNKLISAENLTLPATTLVNWCYTYMFQGCTSLTTAPELPATTLADGCYFSMFNGCTSLTTAPVLPATTLVSRCYQYMFQGCSRLNYIKAMFTTTPSSQYTSYTGDWVKGVAATGTFVKNSAATWTTTGVNAVPSGWTVETASS